MQYHLDLDRRRARLYMRASGLWNVALAERVLRDMKSVRSWAIYNRQVLTALVDLTGLPPHTQEVAPIAGEAASQMNDVEFERYAMIVSGPIMRMQVERIDPMLHLQRQYFDTAEEAAIWLGWDDFVSIRDHEGQIAPDGSTIMDGQGRREHAFATR